MIALKEEANHKDPKSKTRPQEWQVEGFAGIGHSHFLASMLASETDFLQVENASPENQVANT